MNLLRLNRCFLLIAMSMSYSLTQAMEPKDALSGIPNRILIMNAATKTLVTVKFGESIIELDPSNSATLLVNCGTNANPGSFIIQKGSDSYVIFYQTVLSTYPLSEKFESKRCAIINTNTMKEVSEVKMLQIFKPGKARSNL